MKTRSRTWKFAGNACRSCWGEAAPTSRVRCLSLAAYILAVGLGGCVMRGNVEVLETHLRTQETLIRDYESQMTQLRSELTTSQKELDLLRDNLASLGKEATLEENSRSLSRVEGIVFNSLLTAAQNVDGAPGDERLHAVFYPHDAHGDIVKLSGTIELQAVDLASETDHRAVGKWTFTPEQCRELWHAGFITSGYQFDLPWQQMPRSSKVLLLAKLKTTDGRVFETTHTISLSPGMTIAQPADVPLNEMELQPVKFEKRESPPTWADRPVPNPYDGMPLTLPRRKETPGAAELPLEKPAPAPRVVNPPTSAGEVKPGAAAPFPNGLRTSDSWTDQSIPQWR